MTVFIGTAKLLGKGKLSVKGNEKIAATHIIIATGARARQLPGLEADGKLVWTYKEAIVPEAMNGSGAEAVAKARPAKKGKRVGQ